MQVLPVLQTQESRSICAGDSTLIFNQWRSAAGVYAQTFSAQNGCDSTHSVALQVLPVLQTQESRSICAGDSTLIFNQWRSTAGVYAQTFSAQNGCDSTHSVALQVLPVLQTQESRSICAGDSVLIFNQWRSTAGVYAQTFSAQNGCDSTHAVALQVLPVLQTQESRSVCAGDSTLIFNQWRSTAGVYAQTFSAQNGLRFDARRGLAGVASVANVGESQRLRGRFDPDFQPMAQHGGRVRPNLQRAKRLRFDARRSLAGVASAANTGEPQRLRGRFGADFRRVAKYGGGVQSGIHGAKRLRFAARGGA
ncbi:MAG: hypothetical protein IPH12_17230 [Saprospirales bacterium]|nr:hypothetical protein [Saprospirales bacterium]